MPGHIAAIMGGMTLLGIILAAIVLLIAGFGGLWLPRRMAAHLLTIGVASCRGSGYSAVRLVYPACMARGATHRDTSAIRPVGVDLSTFGLDDEYAWACRPCVEAVLDAAGIG